MTAYFFIQMKLARYDQIQTLYVPILLATRTI